jgi:hypothetical protein
MNRSPWRAGERRELSSASAITDDEETQMRLLGKTAIVFGMAGAMALGSMTASEARNRGAAIAAGAAGFVAGAAIGAAAANANAGYYYGGGYSGYDSYAYAPVYAEPAYAAPVYAAPVYAEPVYVPGSYYGPVYGYNNTYNYNWRQRQLDGRD